ncbi:RsmE family RNA methyltransferase [bacterium]|nr:RsmE family RNA methyltransferase [bacterium]NBX77781.1 RsmE family RNA methyltransferase [bacterium]
MKTAHQFAFFYTESLAEEKIYSIQEESFVHRLFFVLRMQSGEQCILFNRKYHALVELLALSKKEIKIKVLSVVHHTESEKKVTICLPILKKESMHEALYGLCEIGVHTIQLVHVSTSHVKSWTQKDQEKAEKIVIAAAEQSKNFIFPIISAPISFDQMVQKYHTASCKIFFDAQGTSFFLHNIQEQKEIVCFVGPEADLTDQDKSILQKSGWVFVVLTQTILRACQAAVLGAAMCLL